MGVFDYVVLSKELKERLGRFGEENYQTKYLLEGSFISVYNGFDTHRRLWELITWIELLVEPKPSSIDMEPFLKTVKLEDIGVVRLVKVSTTLRTHIYDIRGIEEDLMRLGFKGPKLSEDNILSHRYEELGRIYLQNDKAEIELTSIEDESSPYGIKSVIKVRSGNAELSIDNINVTFKIESRSIVATLERMEFRKIKVSEWVKNLKIKGINAELRVRIRREFELSREADLNIEGYVEVIPSEVSEELVNELIKLTEDAAKEVLKS